MLEVFHLEENGVPIYVQIRDQILTAVGSGALGPGERLPTMREVAVALKVDLNTVRHAYEAAQDTGAIVLVRSRGTFVSEPPPPLDEAERRLRLDTLAYQSIAAANAAGLNPEILGQRIIELSKGETS
jgi:GntR family transcriptional regulator